MKNTKGNMSIIRGVITEQGIDAEQKYPYEDAALKVAAQYFGEEFLPYLGIKEKLRYIAPTENVHLEVRKMYQDFNYVVEDGSWLHLEFESDSIRLEDLRRFREYEATTSRTYKVEVNTCVICSSSVKKVLTELKSGMSRYRIRVIRLKDKDADQIYEKLFRKQRDKIPLDKGELVEAVLTLLMSGESSEKERVLNVTKILKNEEESTARDEMEKLQAIIYAFAVKFLTKTELDEVKEVLKMTILGELLREDALMEGRAEGRKRTIISKICKKLKKGQNAEQIADALEEEISYVESICDVAKQYAPEYEEDRICEAVILKEQRDE